MLANSFRRHIRPRSRSRVSPRGGVGRGAAATGLVTDGPCLESAVNARLRRQAVGLSDTPGLLVAAIEPASPADAAGLARGDLIVEMNGDPALSVVAAAEMLHHLPADQDLELTVLRGNERHKIRLDRRLPGPAAR